MDSVDAALRFLQRSFASVANEEAQWQEERNQLEMKVRELENQRQAQEEAYRDALYRVKMLEFALRQERGRYMLSAAPVMSSTPASNKKSQSAEITRPIVTSVQRSVERVNTHSPSPSPSPSGSPKTKSNSIHRTDSANHGPNRSPSTPKHTEVSRPLMGSRTTSSAQDSPSSDVPKPKPNPPAFSLGPKTPSTSSKPHKLKVKLSGHLDSVHKICFHPTEPILVSGGDDYTVKIWNLMNFPNGPTSSSRTTELDPILTVRTHTDSILAVTVIPPEFHTSSQPHRSGAFVSAGRDGSICLMNLPSSEIEKGEPFTYEDYQGLKSHTISKGHENAVWDLHAHPLSNVLFSAGADGIVRTWMVKDELILKSELKCSTKHHANAIGHNIRGNLIPTSVNTVMTDSKTCIVGYTSASVAQFDFHGEKIIQVLRSSDIDNSESRDAQINQVISHPTMPIVIAAHQDRKLRFYDLRTGECVHTINAHQDAVSSLSIDSSGLYLASGGHDGSLRIWSVADKNCVFEQSVHRPKYSEAVHTVAYHPTRNFVATGGADSLIKIFQ